MATIQIKGMSCNHCVNSVKETLKKLSGVDNVEVNLEKGEASYDGDVSSETIRDAITQIGFEIE